jgi:beta-lactamase regulating signal transducer with metallopeptidase domain
MVLVAKAYMILNLLCVAAALLLTAAEYLQRPAGFQLRLRLAYLLIGWLLVAPLASTVFAPVDFMPPTSQIFAAESMRVPAATFSSPGNISVAVTPGSAPVPLPSFASSLVLLLLAGIILFAGRTLWSARRLFRLLRAATPVRRLAGIHILVTEQTSVPFSFWIPGRSFVVISSDMIGQAGHTKMAIAHELQHHRQHDTRWLHIMTGLKTLMFWNPFVHVLDRRITHLQEFACDEALAGHRGFSSLAYCRCLLWVAEKSLQPVPKFAGTASLTNGTAGKVLKRRIELMMTSRRENFRKASLALTGTVALALMSGLALVANASVQDRRISITEAEAMAENARSGSEFPVVVNDLVLAQLNRYLGTPDGREFFRTSVARMQNWRETIEGSIGAYQLPVELMAVPLVESGYRNLTQSGNPAHGAGIWMFIARTARAYGLRVDDQTDDRLDVPKETDAAMRLLSALHLRFQDWGLALLGYNAGAGMVARAIDATGSRDVWQLVRAGYENDPDYVARVMAAVLITKNPEILK